MGTHAVFYYEEPNAEELIEVAWQDSAPCMRAELESQAGIVPTETAGTQNLREGGSVSWGGYPCGEETSSDVYCSTCGEFMWAGVGSERGQQ